MEHETKVELIRSEIDAAVASGPGVCLRNAREARSLDPSDVAQELGLKTKIIEALEEDDYLNLPPACFVRGYIRKYAIYLGLSADILVASYDKVNVTAKEVQLQPIMTKPTSYSQKLLASGRTQESLHWVGYLVAFLMITLVIIGWRSEHHEANNDTITTVAVNQAPIKTEVDIKPTAAATNITKQAATPPAGVKTPIVSASVLLKGVNKSRMRVIKENDLDVDE